MDKTNWGQNTFLRVVKEKKERGPKNLRHLKKLSPSILICSHSVDQRSKISNSITLYCIPFMHPVVNAIIVFPIKAKISSYIFPVSKIVKLKQRHAAFHIS